MTKLKHQFKVFSKHDDGRIIYQCPVCKAKSMAILTTECKPQIERNPRKPSNHFIFQKTKAYAKIMYGD